ncbi:MAG: hypothetical protein CVU47_02410 [Chloroflexi bacterium HGW-Chloroflexi-9]|nr:MAG: hypothetical protein CVU47_02410 [Chloroflexi bacterium HGW-Chloroflexi-9]
MAGGAQAGTTWGGLASLPEADRVGPMCDLLREVMSLPEDQRTSAMDGMVRAEYALDEATLHSFTASRLRAWLRLAGEDMDLARSMSQAWDHVFDGMPAETAMRRATVVQTVARSELNAEEVSVLFEFIPSIVRQIPRAPSSLSQRLAEAPPERDTPWWKFWG